MKKKELADLREKNIEALEQLLAEKKKNLFDLRVQAVTQKIENPMTARHTRREIAQIRTVLREKQGPAVEQARSVQSAQSVLAGV